jgi:hypothetical protein
MILIWLFILKFLWKKWQIEAIILEKRGDNLIKTNDRCGRYKDDAMGIVGYRLQKSKDTIPIYNYDWVLHNVAVPTTIFERFVNLLRGNIGTIFLFRYGSKQYKPIDIRMKKADWKYKEVKDENGESTYIQVYQQFDPRDKLGALNFEVVDWDNMNFMVQEQRAAILRRQKQSELWKQIIIPAIIIGGTIVVCIFMLYFSNAKGTELMNAAPARATTVENQPAQAPANPITGALIPGA